MSGDGRDDTRVEVNSDEKRVPLLVRRRATIKCRLTKFENYLIRIGVRQLDENEAWEVEMRLKRADSLLDEFVIVQNEIRELIEEEDSADEEYEVFEASYFRSVKTAKALVAQAKNASSIASHASAVASGSGVGGSIVVPAPSLKNGSNSNANIVNVNNGGAQIRLPQIELSKFSGGFEAWTGFRDVYEALIHGNTALVDIQRYHYLRASLEGDAAEVIRSIEFCAENYTQAWNLLCERYNNNRWLVHNHLKAIFDLPTVSRESAQVLRVMADSISKHLGILRTLGQPTEHWDEIVIYLVVSKLDVNSTREWEVKVQSNGQCLLTDLLKFIRDRASVLETIELKRGDTRRVHVKESYSSRNSNAKAFVVTTYRKCTVCNDDRHHASNCSKLLAISVNERRERVKALNLCFNCLRKGHMVRDCRSKHCSECNRKHNTILHYNEDEGHAPATNIGHAATTRIRNDNDNEQLEVIATTATYNECYTYSNALIPTAIILVKRHDGTFHEYRALLDSGAQTNFVSSRLIGHLRIKSRHTEAQLNGIGGNESHARETCEIHIKSRTSAFQSRLFCYVLPQITKLVPSHEIEVDVPDNMVVADETFDRPGPVDVLLGAGIFWDLLEPQQVKRGRNKPIFQNSKLGWLVSEPLACRGKKVSVSVNIANLEIQHQLSKFWEIEEIQGARTLSKEEIVVEKHFESTCTRKSDGRFMVRMPLKQPPVILGASFENAKRRFFSVEKRLMRNPDVHTRYAAFMKEYEELKHMSEIDRESEKNEIEYFIPHHAVLNSNSSTTRLRVVFDASAKTTSGVSLNDIQQIGPVIQDDLLSILLRFRIHNYVVSADIEKMYRQIEIDPSQRNLQKIVWRNDPSEPIRCYTLNTVTYGTASASYQAIRCLHEVANNVDANKPEIARVIRKDFYVDDLLTGAKTIEEAVVICKETSDALNTACFPLRKWMTNAPEILVRANLVNLKKAHDFGSNENSKTLGLLWSQETDMLSYRLHKHEHEVITKRIILSVISQVFDPLGLVAPIIIKAKIILQKLWLEKLDWDDTISDQLRAEWERFYTEIEHIGKLKIMRQVSLKQFETIEIHGFGEASQLAYGACVYVRTVYGDNVSAQLLAAKSRVAPLKTVTIPRLELCAALLLTKLVKKIVLALGVSIDSLTMWTDSTIVLGWLQSSPAILKTFVGHRVATIQQLGENVTWKHVPTNENPADIISRGLFPDEIKDAATWWHGPWWLRRDKESWPSIEIEGSVALPEMKGDATITAVLSTNGGISTAIIDCRNHSSLTRLERITAYVLRFLHNCRCKNNKQLGGLTHIERRDALNWLIKLAQNDSFAEEIQSLKSKGNVKMASRLATLCPFVDERGILRVGGRLIHSRYAFTKKHPALLSSKHYLAVLIARDTHVKYLHVSPQSLLNLVRERFWIIGGRNLTRKIVYQCIMCFRARPRILQPQMGNLPEARISPSFPFLNTGLDYAGPIMLKTSNTRGCRSYKAYIGIFVCMATKAVHLELITGLTTQAFIATLRRFVARRGLPAHVYSDNGSNFVGARAELKELFSFLKAQNGVIENHAADQQFVWHFIPARAPNFGGLWEAGVKAIKTHLKRVVGERLLTYEDFVTLLVQIEGMLNSRPLSMLPTDPNDNSPLTPAHFLIGRPITAVADPDLSEILETRMANYQRTQSMVQHFWARWKREYLHQLQTRPKWQRQPADKMKIGSVVLVVDENCPPMQWKFGKITELHPGRDQIVRVVSIKMSSGTVRRPVSKVAVLPTSEGQSTT